VGSIPTTVTLNNYFGVGNRMLVSATHIIKLFFIFSSEMQMITIKNRHPVDETNFSCCSSFSKILREDRVCFCFCSCRVVGRNLDDTLEAGWNEKKVREDYLKKFQILDTARTRFNLG
jgi:hypothetical protein